MRQIQVGERRIGDGCPVFIIAEIGYNFNTLDEGLASVDAAAACGVDAVKFQTFRAETVCSRRTDFPAEAGSGNQFDEFKRYEISEETHRRLFERARQKRLVPFSTPSFYDDVELLERVGVDVHKVGSDDLTNLPFLRFVASKGKPVIFSTGMGTLAEAAQALEVLRGPGDAPTAILHCVSNYPIRDPRVINLRVLETFRKAFPVPVGFSDHTTGIAAALGAVALGATILERHFTIDKRLPVPDAGFSADPAEMAQLVRAVRELEQSLGSTVKAPADSEKDMRRETRKSAVARRPIAAGEILTENMIIVKRPGHGVPPEMARLLVGRRAKTPIAADEAIGWDRLE